MAKNLATVATWQQKASEKRLERRLRNAIRKRGGVALKFSSSYSTKWADRFILMPGGKFYLAEIKSGGKPLNPGQRARAKRARKMGFTVFEIDTVETLKHALRIIDVDQL